MSKRWIHWGCLAVGCLALHGTPASAEADGLTLLVMPARYSTLQLGFDIARTFPTVLVSYRGDASSPTPVIDAWDGSAWVPVSVADYQDGRFLTASPRRAILIGDDRLLPPAMREVERWCPSVNIVPATDTPTILNHVGRWLDFSSADWKWFAARYRLQLKDLNADARRTSWYDLPHPEFKRADEKDAAPADTAREIRPIPPLMTIEAVEVTEVVEVEPADHEEAPVQATAATEEVEVAETSEAVIVGPAEEEPMPMPAPAPAWAPIK